MTEQKDSKRPKLDFDDDNGNTSNNNNNGGGGGGAEDDESGESWLIDLAADYKKYPRPVDFVGFKVIDGDANAKIPSMFRLKTPRAKDASPNEGNVEEYRNSSGKSFTPKFGFQTAMMRIEFSELSGTGYSMEKDGKKSDPVFSVQLTTLPPLNASNEYMDMINTIPDKKTKYENMWHNLQLIQDYLITFVLLNKNCLADKQENAMQNARLGRDKKDVDGIFLGAKLNLRLMLHFPWTFMDQSGETSKDFTLKCSTNAFFKQDPAKKSRGPLIDKDIVDFFNLHKNDAVVFASYCEIEKRSKFNPPQKFNRLRCYMSPDHVDAKTIAKQAANPFFDKGPAGSLAIFDGSFITTSYQDKVNIKAVLTQPNIYYYNKTTFANVAKPPPKQVGFKAMARNEPESDDEDESKQPQLPAAPTQWAGTVVVNVPQPAAPILIQQEPVFVPVPPATFVPATAPTPAPAPAPSAPAANEIPTDEELAAFFPPDEDDHFQAHNQRGSSNNNNRNSAAVGRSSNRRQGADDH